MIAEDEEESVASPHPYLCSVPLRTHPQGTNERIKQASASTIHPLVGTLRYVNSYRHKKLLFVCALVPAARTAFREGPLNNWRSRFD